jgi:hypothetical protein
MSTRKKIQLFAAILLLFSPAFIYSQTAKNVKQLHWEGIKALKLNENIQFKTISFSEAVFDFESEYLPHYIERTALNSTNSNFTAKINNQTFEKCTDEEVNFLKKKNIGNSIKIETYIETVQKSDFGIVKFLPIRKNPTNGTYEKLVSFSINYDIKPGNFSSLRRGKDYAANSVLSQGSWYKVKTSNTGIHKITYGDLQNMGFNMSSIVPSKIGVFGNGGAMLPERNKEFYYDDLKENSIYVHGESDGSFDQGDYILFYSLGTVVWTPDYSSNSFRHKANKYDNYAYYFITIDQGTGKRIASEASVTAPANYFATSFHDARFHEKDSLNLIKTGREWFGEVFDIKRTHSFNFSFPNIKSGSCIMLRSNVAARSVMSTNNTFTVNANGSIVTQDVPIVGTSYNTWYARIAEDTMCFNSSSANINVSYTFNNTSSSSLGWLNWIELTAERDLTMHGNQMLFRNLNSVGAGNITEFTLSNASSAIKIWDVTEHTEPKLVQTNLSGSNLVFRLNTDTLREFAAHNGNFYYSVANVGSVSNQNLHGIDQHDMVIVTHPSFKSYANEIAKIHQSEGLTVYVTELLPIYNEFSSGKQDIGAIRNFMKMLYDRAGSDPSKMPKYLLLFGDGSYDPKNRLSDNTNFIPTFQSQESLNPAASYVTDDFFGLLDDQEGSGSAGALDIGIGRFPVSSTQQAAEIITKIKRYISNENATTGNCLTIDNIKNLGDWRNTICFVADDEDGNTHINQAELLATYVDTTYEDYNIDKIYFDAFTQLSTPGGQKYPEVTDAINNRVEKGALILNYTGHGGEIGWAHESVLGISDINNWSNANSMPVFVTATCEFSRFDDPGRTSAGELVFLNPNGGAIAMFTTTRLAYSNTNFNINDKFLKNAFRKENGEFLKMGDIIRKAKVASGSVSQNRNFVLLGDPALKMAYPEYDVTTTQINNVTVTPVSTPDTLKALAKVTISGFIADDNGNKKTDFEGVLYPTVFDKPATYQTIGNDPGSYSRTFTLQKNILYKGKASIKNGDFSFTFIVPKDIAYKYGFGKISFYAENGETDANGYFTNIIIGGSSDNPIVDNTGPKIELFMNNEDFVIGGITDENPLLLAFVEDSNGINTVGNGIGHDIVAILDENTNKSVVLNEFYESDLDSYKKGSIRYQYTELEEGVHTLKVKVWDILNNSSEAYTEFLVKKSAELTLKNVLNYPNPFTTNTSFIFEHNQSCCELDIQIQIFSISGRLVKTIEKTIPSIGFIVNKDEIIWDGRDDYGDKIGRGVYIYRVRVWGDNERYCEKSQKLVILD